MTNISADSNGSNGPKKTYVQIWHEKADLEARKNEYKAFVAKSSAQRIPIIIDISSKDIGRVPQMDKYRFAIPNDFKVSDVLIMIRKRLLTNDAANAASASNAATANAEKPLVSDEQSTQPPSVPSDTSAAPQQQQPARKFHASESLVLMARNGETPLLPQMLMSEVYEQHKSEDGFLYLNYMLEAVFGL